MSRMPLHRLHNKKSLRRPERLGVILIATALLGLALASLPAAASPLPVNGLIAFDRTDFSQGTDATYTMNPDGTDLRLAFAGGSVPHWSPDGTMLAMQTPYNGGCSGPVAVPPCSTTTILNPDTGSYRILTPPD